MYHLVFNLIIVEVEAHFKGLDITIRSGKIMLMRKMYMILNFLGLMSVTSYTIQQVKLCIVYWLYDNAIPKLYIG